MAKQTGILPIEGTIGNLTFFKSKDGFMVKSKSSISGDRIASDPNFQRTRENNNEFGRAGSASKLLRTAFRTTITKAKDSRMVSRLTAQMLKVIQADTTSDRGLRNVIDGEAMLMEGFDFNLNSKLSATLLVAYTTTFDRTSGEGTITLSPFVPKNLVVAPTGATHFRLFTGITAVDFEGENYEGNTFVTDTIPYDNEEVNTTALTATVSADSPHPVFMALGIEFLQQVNGKWYPLNNGSFNACNIISVSVPA